MRKIMSLALVLMLVLCLATTAFAAEPTFIEDPTVPTGLVLGAGETVEYQVRAAGMTMTITNAADLTVTIDGAPVAADGDGNIVTVITVMGHPMFAPPTSIVITNGTDGEITGTMSFAYPVGSYNNPEEAALGTNTADVPADGYYYTYTAETDGVLVVTPEGENWTVCINNETAWTYGDTVYASDGVGFAACGMAAGDVLKIILGTEDWTEATITFTASVVDHITTKVDAAEAKCHAKGNIEHYYCLYCDGYFADADATSPLTEDNVFCYPALGSENMTHNAEVPAGCHNDGTIEHWICNDCGKYFEDEACTIETSQWSLGLWATGAVDVTHVEAQDPGCHSAGNTEYWVCGDCNGFFEDEGCWWSILPEAVVVAPVGSENVEHFDAVDASCHDRGNVEYWYCADCDSYYLDEACTQLTNAMSIWLGETGSENIEHVEAVEPGCHDRGNVEYWYCADCDRYFLDEACTQITNAMSIWLGETGSENIEHVEAVEPGCHDRGNVEYWYCADCDRYFLDEACTQLTNAMSIWLGETGSENVEHFEAVEPTCHDLGNVEYWYCPDCDRHFLDENCTQLTNAMSIWLGALGTENIEHVEAVEPGCHDRGNVEYWYCADCDRYFLDEACTQLTNAMSIWLGELGSENVEHVEAVEPGCHDRGNVEYWYCADCDRYFLDEACTQLTNAMSIWLGENGSENVEHIEAVEAGCHNLGNVEHWYCADCDRYFLDEACTQLTNAMSIVLPATGSENVTHVEAIEPGCHRHGIQEHWICNDCGGYFTDEACTQQVMQPRYLMIPAEGVLEYREKVDATCEENGMEAHWYCPECDCYFTDAEGIFNIASKRLTIEATGHSYVDGKCEHCGGNAPSDNPDTGDVSLLMPIVGLLLSACGTVALVNKKKEY